MYKSRSWGNVTRQFAIAADSPGFVATLACIRRRAKCNSAVSSLGAFWGVEVHFKVLRSLDAGVKLHRNSITP